MPSSEQVFGRSFFKELIAKNQSEKVIDQLIKLAKKINDKEISNSIILLSGRFESYVKDSRNGVLSAEEQEVSLAKLNQSILDLIDDLPDPLPIIQLDPVKPSLKSHFDEADKVMKYMILGLFGLGILGFISSMIYLMVAKSDDWLSNLIPMIASFMVIVTSGFFYFLTKRK